CGKLDYPEGAKESRRKADAADGKVLDRSLGLGTVIGTLRHPDLAHRIIFSAVSVLCHINSPS
ncbi:MAG: hypothetical protein Q8O54_00250, partial [Brevundimonas sp.]|nr:hypothetical protein [Brevundimonas sp.]